MYSHSTWCCHSTSQQTSIQNNATSIHPTTQHLHRKDTSKNHTSPKINPQNHQLLSRQIDTHSCNTLHALPPTQTSKHPPPPPKSHSSGIDNNIPTHSPNPPCFTSPTTPSRSSPNPPHTPLPSAQTRPRSTHPPPTPTTHYQAYPQGISLGPKRTKSPPSTKAWRCTRPCLCSPHQTRSPLFRTTLWSTTGRVAIRRWGHVSCTRRSTRGGWRRSCMAGLRLRYGCTASSGMQS